MSNVKISIPTVTVDVASEAIWEAHHIWAGYEMTVMQQVKAARLLAGIPLTKLYVYRVQRAFEDAGASKPSNVHARKIVDLIKQGQA